MKRVYIYGVFHCCGACEESMMANVKRMSPDTMSMDPSQSIFTFWAAFRFSMMSEGMVRYAVITVLADKIVPIQKYHPHLVYSAVMPAKKMPIQNPKGAHDP